MATGALSNYQEKKFLGQLVPSTLPNGTGGDGKFWVQLTSNQPNDADSRVDVGGLDVSVDHVQGFYQPIQFQFHTALVGGVSTVLTDTLSNVGQIEFGVVNADDTNQLLVSTVGGDYLPKATNVTSVDIKGYVIYESKQVSGIDAPDYTKPVFFGDLADVQQVNAGIDLLIKIGQIKFQLD